MADRVIRLATVIPNKTDATSLYRSIGPLSLLQKQMGNLMLGEMAAIDWSSLSMFDAVFMQRPWVEQHLEITKLVKRQRIPLWVDYDDDLFQVPEWNPVYAQYAIPSRQKAIAETIAMADIVSVSTTQMKENYSKLNDNIVAIPNAWNDFMFPHTQRTTQARKKLITWRGSHTHRNDLISIRNAVVSLSNEHPEVTWNFIGENPWFTEEMPSKSVIITPSMDPLDYMAFMKAIEPSIHIVPLTDCMFNRAKSNIAWIEATMAGAVCVAPKFPEFEKPGILNYQNQAEFHSIMTQLIEGKVDMESFYQASLSYIQENLKLTHVNELRFKIINSLTNATENVAI